MPSSSSNYYISNGIKNLKLNVELKYIGATSFGQLEYQQNNNTIHNIERELSTLSINNKDQNINNKAQYESAVISWQQKLIHPLERLSIPKVEITTENNENKENDDNEKTEENGKDETKISRIFTYVNNELIDKNIIDTKDVNTSGSFTTGVRKRKVAPVSTKTIKEPVGLLNSKQRKIQRTIPSFKQSMQIMAYFGPLTKSSDEIERVDEIVLCKITCINNRQVVLEPDLGVHQIESRYGLYNVSLSMYEDDIRFDSIIDVNDYLNGSHKDIDEDATIFDLPNQNKIWMQYLITIDEALNFPNDGIYIEYAFELPSHVRYGEGYEELAYGRTQICFTKSENDSDISRFSFPVEMMFEFSDKPNHNCPIKWPHLLIKVMSEDYWQRSFVNGYGELSLPITSGKHSYSIHCWRPINPNNHFSIMKDYFLGQSIDIHSIENQGIIDSSINNTLSNISILTESSGTVTFTVHCMKQSRQFISKEILRSIQYGSLLSKVGLSGSLHWKIMKVLMQFEEARRQLLHVRSKHLPKI